MGVVIQPVHSVEKYKKIQATIRWWKCESLFRKGGTVNG